MYIVHKLSEGPDRLTQHPIWKRTAAAIREAAHHFTQADQVNQLVGASEADPDLGFMARLLALGSLPRTNPGNRAQYIRCNGPYKGSKQKRVMVYGSSCQEW